MLGSGRTVRAISFFLLVPSQFDIHWHIFHHHCLLVFINVLYHFVLKAKTWHIAYCVSLFSSLYQNQLYSTYSKDRSVCVCVCVLCTVCYLSMFGLQQSLGAILSGIWKGRTIAPSVTCLCFEGGNPVRWKHWLHTHTHTHYAQTHIIRQIQIVMLRCSIKSVGMQTLSSTQTTEFWHICT